MDHQFNPIYNMPIDQKKELEEQRKILSDLLETIKTQQGTIASLTAVTAKQSKSINSLLRETQKQGKHASRIGNLSLTFSILAVAFAGIAVWFSLQDFHSDKLWQQEQTGILKEIRELIQPGIEAGSSK